MEGFTADLGRFVGNLTGFRHALTEVLARLEVESDEDRHDALQQEALETLDTKLHRAVAVEPTDNPGLNKRGDAHLQARVLPAGADVPAGGGDRAQVQGARTRRGERRWVSW